MTAGRPPEEPAPDLAGEWQLDAEPIAEPEAPPLPEERPEAIAPIAPIAPASPVSAPAARVPAPDETPPSPEQIIEAMLFVGGPPLSVQAACSAIRGLTSERFLIAIDTLTRNYRLQRRPCSIQFRESGYSLEVMPAFRGLRERLLGGPREARLSQPALDVLSVIAYRQPVGKAEVDTIRGLDSGAILRQLVRLGLIVVRHRAESESREVRYGTTPRFLVVFSLGSLDELPRLGDTAQV